MSNKTEKCENCRQEIPSSKIELHKSFCLKNNKYCPTCSKVFLKKEFTEHLKTHIPLNFNKNPQQIPEKKTITNQKNSLSEHKKNCHHEKEIPKIEKRKIHVDDSLGLKQCDYCYNMFDNIEDHLTKCKAKKYIEEENRKYYESLKKRMEDDNKLANKLSKEKPIMDTKNDENLAKEIQNKLKPIIDTNNDENLAKELQNKLKPIIDTNNDENLAKELQKEMKPIIDTNKDEEMARKLQKEMKPIIDTNKDEEMAKSLQKKMKPIIDTNKDEEMAKSLQKKMKPIVNTNKDEEMARKLQEELNRNNNNSNNFNSTNGFMDEDLKRVIEASKNDY